MSTNDAAAPQASATAITLNLITMGFGTGLLTMPWGTAGSSMVMAIALLALVLAMNYWTIMILVRASELKQEFDLGGILSHLPGRLGPVLQQVGTGVIWLSQFLVLLGYTIVVSDSLSALLAGTALANKELLSALLACVVTPLSALDQKYLAFTSTLSILANIYLVALIMWYAIFPTAKELEQADSDSCVLGFSTGTITAFSLIMYTIIIQMVIPQMYQELEERSPAKFARCLATALFVLFFFFAATMIGGYVAFGANVNSNVMNELPADSAGNLARAMMAVCIMGCYPLNVKPMVAPFLRSPEKSDKEALLGSSGDGSVRKGKTFEVMAILTVVLPVTIASFFFRNLGPLNAVNGAIQVIAYIGLIPGAAGLFLLGELSQKQRFALHGLIVFAVITAALGFVMTNNEVDDLKKKCMYWVQVH